MGAPLLMQAELCGGGTSASRDAEGHSAVAGYPAVRGCPAVGGHPAVGGCPKESSCRNLLYIECCNGFGGAPQGFFMGMGATCWLVLPSATGVQSLFFSVRTPLRFSLFSLFLAPLVLVSLVFVQLLAVRVLFSILLRPAL
jgi:hypothetical protein